jgi:hypothetical protein
VSAALLTAIASLLVATIAGVFGYLNSTRANRPAEMNAQLAWVRSAQDDATAAREESKAAKTEATAARQEADATWRRTVQLRRDIDGIQDWVDRVMRAADAYRADAEAGGRVVEDPGVIRLLNVLNGGPNRPAP